MRTRGIITVEFLLYTTGGESREPLFDALIGRTVHADTLLWRAPDDRLVTGTRIRGESQTGGTAAVHDGPGDAVYQAPYQSVAARTSRVSLLAPGGADHAGESGLEYGYHLYPPPGWLCIFSCRPGLVQSLRIVMGRVYYDGRELLSRRLGAGVAGGATGGLS